MHPPKLKNAPNDGRVIKKQKKQKRKKTADIIAIPKNYMVKLLPRPKKFS
jgi:hypothetical protein